MKESYGYELDICYMIAILKFLLKNIIGIIRTILIFKSNIAFDNCWPTFNRSEGYKESIIGFKLNNIQKISFELIY